MTGARMSQREALLEAMMRLRAVELRIAERYPEQEMRCPTHLSVGQETAPVAVCAALEPRDYVLSHHRSHGHYLAKGGDLDAMIAEMYGRATGCCGGKGGSMHLIDLEAGFLGAVPIVGSTIPIAVGAAFGARMRGEDRVAVVFLGDAAVEEGVVHESLSFASTEQLPVLFVCENNLYSVQTPLEARQPDRPIHTIADAHRVPHAQIHGEDVFAVHALATEAVGRARAGGGPTFLEVLTYRYLEHVGPFEDADLGYRTQDEIDAWRARDPIDRATRALLDSGEVTEARLEQWREDHREAIDRAFARALEAPTPDPATLHTDVRRGTASLLDTKEGAR